MEDLEAATLDDVHSWFRDFYGAANAVIVVAGDIDPETARERVEHYFGHIPPGPPLTRQQTWVPRLEGEHRARMEDRVPQARLYRVWNIPQGGTEEGHHLEMVANLLTQGRACRLQRRLIQEEEVATDVVGFTNLREIAGQMILWATARPGQDLTEVERPLDEELARFLEEGPTERELQGVKTQMRASFLRGIERIGGFGGKSDILAENEVYGGDPGRYRERLVHIDSATREDLLAVAREWLRDGSFLLEVHPYPEYRVAEAEADRTTLPMPTNHPEVSFPRFERTTLSNGLEVVFTRRSAVPLVSLSLLVDAGYAADQSARPGTASLTATMLSQGTRNRTALEIAEEISMLGMTLGSGANVDASTVSATLLKENLKPSLELFSDVVLNPTFPAADFQREQRQRLAQIQREKVTPVQMGLRVLPALLYGEDHAYGTPLTGSGTEESVTALTGEDLARFHETWYRPNNATLVVVGDISLQELTPQLESLFSGWAAGEVPGKNLGTVDLPAESVVYLMDRPGSTQSVIFAGHPVPPKAHPDDLALGSLESILGGAFTSRINMNLREEKGWSYGAFTILWDAEGQRPFFAFAPVQADRTVESMAELMRELKEAQAERPPSHEELEKARDLQVLTLPGLWETNGAVLGSLTEMVRFGLAEDHFDTLDDRLRELSVGDLARVAREHLHPDRMVWVVVGDLARFEDGIRELGFGEVRFIDPDGRVVDR